MTVGLGFILQLLQLTPTIAGAAVTLKSLFSHPALTVVDSSGAAVSAAALKDLQDAAAAATASAVTGVQTAG